MAYKKRTRNLFDPKSEKPFKLSRSRLELFSGCPRCFYLDRRLGLDRPPGFPFNLNSAVDQLLKNEFDQYREKQEPHPLMKKYGVDAVPFQHENLNVWRENFKGAQYHHEKTNFIITGAIDDLWVSSSGELIIVDYKATSKGGEITLEDEWKNSYKRQMEIYQWIFRGLSFNVSNTGYFVYANGMRDIDGFYDRLEFKTILLPYNGNDSWIDELVVKVHDCLSSEMIPECNPECDYCKYRSFISAAEDNLF